jgi:hypothetical protein
MSNRKKWRSKKPLGVLRTRGRRLNQRRQNGSKKASAHGAGGTLGHTENRKGLRYNDRSVYPRAKACGALFESACATPGGSVASFFTPLFLWARMRNWLGCMVFCTLWTCSLGVRADLYKEVNTLVQNGQWAQAQALAETRLKTVPTDPQMRLLQSHIQTGLGQTQAAMDTLRALTQSFPELPEPHNNLAALLVRENRHDEALVALQAALRARPDYALALENLGDLHLALAAQAFARARIVVPTQTRLQTKQLATEQVMRTP